MIARATALPHKAETADHVPTTCNLRKLRRPKRQATRTSYRSLRVGEAMDAMDDTHLVDDLDIYDADFYWEMAYWWRRIRVACVSAMEQAGRRVWTVLDANRGIVITVAMVIELTRYITVFVCMLSALIEWALNG